MKLYTIIEADEPNFEALAPAVEADVAISYRLLSFLNSARFSFSTTITSIRQAIVLAGWKPIRNWLRLIILTDMAPSEKTIELSYLSAQRGKFFELIALAEGYENLSDKLFMLGLLSLLDALLDIPMCEIMKNIPMGEDITGALCGEENIYSPWLELARAIEASDWGGVGAAAQKLNISPGTIAVANQQAFSWADSFFKSS